MNMKLFLLALAYSRCVSWYGIYHAPYKNYRCILHTCFITSQSSLVNAFRISFPSHFLVILEWGGKIEGRIYLMRRQPFKQRFPAF